MNFLPLLILSAPLPERERPRLMKRALLLVLVGYLVLVAATARAASGDPKEYKTGKLDHWDLLSTGTDCSTSHGIFTGASTHCGKSGVRVYHVLTEDGFDYTVQPDTWDPLKALPLGQQINYRVDEKGAFWTPDPKHGTCNWCSREKQKNFREGNDPDNHHEAKYFVSLVEKSKVLPSAPPLTNKDVVEMFHAGLSESLVIEKINTSSPEFDVTIPALKSLKDSGVSDAVISAMMHRGEPK